MMKKILSLILSISLLATIFNINVYAAGGGGIDANSKIGFAAHNGDDWLYVKVTASPSSNSTKYSLLGYKLKIQSANGKEYSTFISYTGINYSQDAPNVEETQFICTETNFFNMMRDSNRGDIAQAAINNFQVTGGTLIADAVMTIAYNGKDVGSVKNDGTVNTPPVYYTEGGIKGAAGWTTKTLAALDTYFGIQVPYDGEVPAIIVQGTDVTIEADQSTGLSTVTVTADFSQGNLAKNLAALHKTPNQVFKSITFHFKGQSKTVAVGAGNTTSTTFSYTVNKAGLSPGVKNVVSIGANFDVVTYEGITRNVAGTGSINVMPKTTDPYIDMQLSVNPEKKLVDGTKDETATVTVKATAVNVNSSNVKDWSIYARFDSGNITKDDLSLQHHTSTVHSNSITDTFTFTVTKDKFNVDDFIQNFKVTAQVDFINLINNQSFLKISDFIAADFYKNPPPPGPVAIEDLPSSVKAGYPVTAHGDKSYALNGATIKEYDWGATNSSYDFIRPSGSSCTLQWPDAGTSMVNLYVVDSNGMTGVDFKPIVITPPYPDAHLDFSGVDKENRTVHVSALNSTSPAAWPIDKSKTVVTVTGSNPNDIKYNGTLVGFTQKDFTFKSSDSYIFTVTVTNTKGLSDTKTYTKFIAPDLDPDASFGVDPKIVRDTTDSNGIAYATVKIQNGAYSPDGDYVASITGMYKWDSDNDGDFSDESWVTFYTGAPSDAQFTTTKVGLYLIRWAATEGTNQEYMTDFVSPSDFKTAYTESQVEVVNIAPNVSFVPQIKKKVDFYLDVANTNMNSSAVVTEFNNIVRPYMLSNNFDYTLNSDNSYLGYSDAFSGQGVGGGAVMADGTVKVWDGNNEYGIIGQGFTGDRYQNGIWANIAAPNTVPGLTGVKSICYATTCMYYIMNDGTVKYSGLSYLTGTPSVSTVPITIPGLNNVKMMVSSGAAYLLVLFNDGTVKVGTYAYENSLFGGATPTSSYTLTSIPNLSNVVDLGFSGGSLAFALKSNGTVVVWGRPYIPYGYDTTTYLGIKLTQESSYYVIPTPTTIPGITNATNIFIGDSNVFVKLEDGSYKGWGDNTYGTLGIGDKVGRYSVTSIPWLKDAKSVEQYFYSCFGVMKDGTVKYCGNQYLRCLPTGTMGDNIVYPVATTTPELSNVRYIHTFGLWSIAVLEDGTAMEFGDSNCLVTGTRGNAPIPVTELSNSLNVINTKPLDKVLPSVSWRDDAKHIFVDISNITRPEMNINATKAAIITDLQENDVYYVGMGTSSIQALMNSIVSQNTGNGMYTDSSNLDNAFNSLVTYVSGMYANPLDQFNNYVCIGQEIEIKPFFSDYENDPQLAARYKYTHTDPNYYDNSLGVMPESGQYLNTPLNTFSKVGLVDVEAGGQDQPLPDPKFSNYDLWNTNPESKIQFKVGRKPIADLSVTITGLNGSNYVAAIDDSSYDLDHTSRADKGLVDRVLSYMDVSTGTWTSIPFPLSMNSTTIQLAPNKDYLFRVVVRDMDGDNNLGFWSDPDIVSVTTKNVNFPPVGDVYKTGTNTVYYNRPQDAADVDLQIKFSDPDGNLDHVNYAVTNSPTDPTSWTTVNSVGGADVTIHKVLNQDGTYYVIIDGYDTLGLHTKKIRGPFVILHNQPPTVNINGTDPAPPYEGDNVSLLFTPADPDNQVLTASINLKKDGAAYKTINSITINPKGGGGYNQVKQLLENNMPSGSYNATVTVTDTYGASASDTYNFVVADLSVTGFVDHTVRWNQNRQAYNYSKTGTANNPRTYGMFFPGESFILNAVTTTIDPARPDLTATVSCSMQGYSFSDTLSKLTSTTWNGSIWDDSMMYWGDRTLTFIFTAHYSNGTIKTYSVNVDIVDDEYWRQHTKL